jgi:hypothetical protein
MKQQSFTVTLDNKEVEISVREPLLQDYQNATQAYNQAFSDAIKSKAIVRAKIDEILKEQGLWDDNKQNQLDEMQRSILEMERKLAKGGIGLSEAKQIALKIKDVRSDIRELIASRTSLDNNTAEGQADNARFNFLVSACTVYKDTNLPYFNNMEDYLGKSTSLVGLKAAQTLANMMYGLDNDYEANLPENKFLKKYKFVDEQWRLINKKGQLVDRDGRLLDDMNRYINEKGELVDKYGYRVDDKGEYILDSEPFLDDDGNPIIEEQKKDESTNSKDKSSDQNNL